MSRQPKTPDVTRRSDRGAPRARSLAQRNRGLGLALSLAGHAVILFLLLSMPTSPPRMLEPKPITVELIDGRRLLAPPTSPSPAKPSPAKPHARQNVAHRAVVKPQIVKPEVLKPHLARRTPAPADIAPKAEDETPMAVSDPELSAAQLAGAATAGSGSGVGSGSGADGGACDMAGRLQGALRRDPLVHAAVARFAGKSMMVWDGDWLWFQGDTGKGLTAVRQAIAWEIAFAPAACRAKPMHGLVVFSLNEAQGPVRLAVGLGDWRWSDMLGTRGADSARR